MAATTTPSREKIAALVAHLDEFRTRRAARRRLVAIGEPAVDALIECLKDRDEAIVWCGVTSLKELGAQKAIGPLIDLLEKGELPVEVSDALAEITGQDFGVDADRWRRWQESGSGTATPQSVGAETLMKRAAQGTSMTVSGSGDRYEVTVSLRSGRQQSIAVVFGQNDPEGDELIVVYSDCGAASSQYYEAVLRKNMKVPYGAYGIAEVGGEPHFVMADTLLRADAGDAALRKSIQNVARRADAVEKVVQKEDSR